MARLLDQIIGHEKQIGRFLHGLTTQRIPSTFLFSGPSGVGKKMVAMALAQSILCSQRDEDARACGVCGDCLRVASRNHESLIYIEPEKNQIKIEPIREVLRILSLQSNSQQGRVVVIDQVQYLNVQAANAMLKTLEEPAAGTYFFLITPSTQNVLSTIRSRSQTLAFQTLSDRQLSAKASVTVSVPAWAVRSAHGSFERLHFFTDRDEMETRERAMDLVALWATDPRGFLGDSWKSIFREKSSTLSLGRHLVFVLSDLVRSRIGDEVLDEDNQAFSRLQDKLKNVPTDELLQAGYAASKLEKELLAHRDGQLLFEEFWLRTRPN